jgi:hypothetical protein
MQIVGCHEVTMQGSGYSHGAIVEGMNRLNAGEIPPHLKARNAKKTGQEFDPNSYFTVLTHLSMSEGYTLDYLYSFDDIGTRPLLYARRVGHPPLKSCSQYLDWHENNSLLSFIVSDGTPESFFEIVVFKCLAGQFYLWWHAQYNDLQVITSTADVERIISETSGEACFGRALDRRQIAAARALSAEPLVEMADTLAVVDCTLFTKWGGFYRIRERFLRASPHTSMGHEVTDAVEYDCGVCF